MTKKLILDMIEAARAKAMTRRLGRGAKVVTLMADSGLKYLNTDAYTLRTGPG